jgi:uncharacterized damage-inducible protein DinB
MAPLQIPLPWSWKLKMKIQTKAALVFLTSLMAVSAVAQSAAAITLTPEEREMALKSFQTTRDNFLKSIAGLSQKQWAFKPAPDRWSVAEVSEHITLSEQKLFGLVQQVMKSPATPEKRDQAKGKDELVLQKVPDRSHKVQAPEFLKPTGQFPTEADLVKAFNERRDANMEYIKTTTDDLRDHFFDHPLLGTLDDYQWLLLISAHSARHTAQIEEVKADPNFPKD